jgi:hypothetical protein
MPLASFSSAEPNEPPAADDPPRQRQSGEFLQLVGRSDTIQRILAACDAAAAGHGGVVLVAGGAGIGKTTVATAIAHMAQARRFGVCFSSCLAVGAPPFWPWTQLVSGCTDATTTAESARAAEKILAYLGHAPPADQPGAAAQAAQARVELFEAFTELFLQLSKQGPRLLVIEDLHWADVSSVLLLVQLAAVLKTKRILVVVTIRSDEPLDAPLDVAHTELQRLADSSISLGGLLRSEIGELLQRAAIEPDDSLIDTLYRRTAGNPFFITEIIRSLANNTLPGATRAGLAASDVPTHVGALVTTRLSRLAEPLSELVRAAAVLGLEGDVRLLAKTANVDVKLALERLRWVALAGLIVQRTPDRWAFLHGLVRDAVESTLPAISRARLHEQAANAYESIHGEDACVTALAHHALSSLPLGSVERAVKLGARAAEDAMRRLAFETAARTYEQTIEALPAGDSQRRAELLVGLGNARRAAGDRAGARVAFRSAAGVSGCRSDLLMAAALGYANPAADLGLAYRAEDPESARFLERGLAALPAGDDAGRAFLTARLAAELYVVNRAELSRPLSEAAIRLAQQAGDQRALVLALAVHHDAFVIGEADVERLLRGSEKIMRHARSAGDEHALLIAHRARVFDLLVAGDVAGVDAEIGAFARLTEHRRSPSYLWWPAQWRAMRALLQGEHAQAERLATDAFGIGKQPFPSFAALNRFYLEVFSKREQGRLAELEATTRVLALEYADVPAVTATLAVVLAELRCLDEARGLLLRLGADGFARVKDRNWPACSFMLARVAALVGDREQASELLESSRALAGRCVQVSYATVCLGSADLALAWLAETVGDDRRADAYYDAAEAMNARIGARSWLAQARFDHAQLLGRSARPADLEKSRRLAKLADAARRTLGLSLLSLHSDAAPSDQGSAKPSPAVFRRQSSVWRFAYQRQEATVVHSKGLVDIAWLLAHPGQAISAVELIAAQADGLLPCGDGGEVLDKKARHEVREQLRSLDEDLAEAERAHDLGLIEKLNVERDALVTASAAALGLAGRARRLDDSTERARKAVAARIKNSIQAIAWAHPALGAHLERSVDTGNLCVYRPERPVDWRF